MREFAKISPQIWTSEMGRKIKNLGLEARVISFYLSSNPSAHMTGVYYIPIVLIAHEAGLSVEKATIALDGLCQIGYCTYDYENEYVWVHDMGINQVCATQLKSNDNRVSAINPHYALLPELSFLQNFYNKYARLFLLKNCHDFITPLQAPSDTLRSNEKENDKEIENENKNEKKTILSGVPDVEDEEQISSIKKPDEKTKERINTTLQFEQAKEVLQFLNKKTKRNYRFEESNLKLIVARLRSGADVDDCRAVIVRKYNDWNGTDMAKYLRPATLFNSIKFEQYLGECVIEEEEEEDDVEDENVADIKHSVTTEGYRCEAN
jgi:uncharacterized phage protein (TIGR02220 family)